MDITRLAVDLEYWEEMDESGGEATHYHPRAGCPWLREAPLGYLLSPGLWAKYANSETGLEHIHDAIPKPVAQEVEEEDVEEDEYVRVPFIVGNQYYTLAGELVRFIEVKMPGTSYETMMDEHGVHRYTSRDFGRCTGRPEDHHKNVRPLYRKVEKSV